MVFGWVLLSVLRRRVICGGWAIAETRILSFTPANRSLGMGLRDVISRLINTYSQLLPPRLESSHKTAVESSEGKAYRRCFLGFLGS